MYQNLLENISNLNDKSKAFMNYCTKIMSKKKFDDDLNEIMSIQSQVDKNLQEEIEQIDVSRSNLENDISISNQEWIASKNELEAKCQTLLGIVDTYRKWKKNYSDFFGSCLKIYNSYKEQKLETERSLFVLIQFCAYFYQNLNLFFDQPLEREGKLKKMSQSRDSLNILYHSHFPTENDLIPDHVLHFLENSNDFQDAILDTYRDRLFVPLPIEQKESENLLSSFERVVSDTEESEDDLGIIDFNDYANVFETEMTPSEPVIPAISKQETDQRFMRTLEEVSNLEQRNDIEEPSFENENRDQMIKDVKYYRQINFENYRKKLYDKITEFDQFKKGFEELIHQRMNENAEIDSNLIQEYNKQKEIQDVIVAEIQRIALFTSDDINNIDKNLNIPNLDMDIQTIIDHLLEKRLFTFTEIPNSEKVIYPMTASIEYSLAPTVPVQKKVANEDERVHFEKSNIDRIMEQLEEQNVSEEDVKKVLDFLNHAVKKEAEKRSKTGRFFHVVRKASVETMNILKNDYQRIVSTFLGNEQKEELPQISFGDTFILNSDALVYRTEGLDQEGVKPYYSPDTVRSVMAIGVRVFNEVILVKTLLELSDLIIKGGKVVSVMAFDGFFDVNKIQVLKKGLEK